MPRRRLAATLLASALAAALLATGPLIIGTASALASPADTSSQQQTAKVDIRPVDAAGHLLAGYRVTHNHSRAQCLLGGIAVGTAYRCFAGNRIYDPCWLQAGGDDHVVCLATPWRHGLVRLHVTRGFDNRFGTASPRAWALQLTDGTRCVGSQGASGEVGGRGISYFCLDGKTVLLEEPDTSGALWRIRVARDPSGGYDYRTVGFKNITVAFVGRRSLRP